MKKLFALVLTAFTYASASSQTEIKIEEVGNHIGDSIKVCTKIYGAIINDNAKGDGTYLFAGGNYPDAPLTLLIRNENRKYFDYKPEKDLKDREVCITGRLELVKDKPYIFVSKQEQIEIQ